MKLNYTVCPRVKPWFPNVVSVTMIIVLAGLVGTVGSALSEFQPLRDSVLL